MNYRDAVSAITSGRWHRILNVSAPSRRYLHEDLAWLQVQSRRGDIDGLPRDFHEVWFAHIREMRRRADAAELALFRDLRDKKVPWASIPISVGEQLGSRQAVQQRYGSLQKRIANQETER